jgi:hypothetical protein
VDLKTLKRKIDMEKQPPNGLPKYRLLTGPDDASFCQKVSDTIALGYKLYGAQSDMTMTYLRHG